MKLHLRMAATTAAILALSQPALAQGSQCVQPADLADATTYTMPLAIEALQTKCVDVLPADSFVMSEGDAFATRFMPLNDAAWPGARRFLMTFIENEAGGDDDAAPGEQSSAGFVKLLAEIPGEDLRPFVEAIVREMIAEDVQPGTCADVEKVLPLLAPLPPENYGALVATIIGFVAKDDDDLKLCPAS